MSIGNLQIKFCICFIFNFTFILFLFTDKNDIFIFTQYYLHLTRGLCGLCGLYYMFANRINNGAVTTRLMFVKLAVVVSV